jgi:hypothetical protein
LAAAFSIAREMDQDQIIVVQETEYTGAGKHIQPQLSFARENGIELKFGEPQSEVPGESIILPSHPKLIQAVDLDMIKIRKSLVKNAINQGDYKAVSQSDLEFLVEETNSNEAFVKEALSDLGVTVK